MEITDLAKGRLWSILPARLEAILQKLPDKEAALQAAASFRPQREKDFMLTDGVAVIPVCGPLSRRSSFFSFFFGGTSYASLSTVFKSALCDPDVEAILLDIDSPGGTVAGTGAFGNLVYEARRHKPVVAFAGGMMASAAYWAGSAADAVFVEAAADVGSIGVLMIHYDWSQEDEKTGLKRTFLTAGKYKALGNDAEPLSELARKTFQAQLDYVYTLFVNTVARNRGVDAQTVLRNMSDGRIFIGQQAVDAGLADAVGSFETALGAARKLAESRPVSKQTFIKGGFKMPRDTSITTAAQLAEAYPDLIREIRQEAAEGADVDTQRQEAAFAERERIMGLAAVQFGEADGQKFAAIVNAGVTVEQFEAIRAAAPAPEKPGSHAEILEALHRTGAENPGHDSGHVQAGMGFMAQVAAYQQVHKCSKLEAMQAVMKSDPKAHAAYIKSVN